ncbi:MAG: hypothetical protein ACXABG_09640 [Promethearchaeota archaeon]
MAKLIIPKVKLYIIILNFLAGFSFLTVSFMCFHYVIPGFWICGSACEYIWSWLIDFPHHGACILMCVSRNLLYIPFFSIGLIFTVLTIVLISFRVYREIKR